MSAFICPHCQKPTLEIRAGADLPPDSRDDEIILQSIHCTSCQAAGLAIYQESRRGAEDSEHWSHTGHWLAPEIAQNWHEFLESCALNPDHQIQLQTWYHSDFQNSPYAFNQQVGFPLESATS